MLTATKMDIPSNGIYLRQKHFRILRIDCIYRMLIRAREMLQIDWLQMLWFVIAIQFDEFHSFTLNRYFVWAKVMLSFAAAMVSWSSSSSS